MRAYDCPPPPRCVHYLRRDSEFTGHFQGGEPEFQAVFSVGTASVVPATPGAVISGTLVDCPEPEGDTGWVVVDADLDTVAMQSPVLRSLLIEHDPCQLELVAVLLEDQTGQQWWDWEAYEVSPNGPRILVSDPHSELVVKPACDWIREVRELILPALRAEKRLLEIRIERVRSILRVRPLTNDSPPSEFALDFVKDRFFGPIYRCARQVLQRQCEARSLGNISFRAQQPDEELLRQTAAARDIIAEYDRHATHPAIRTELEARVHNLFAFHAKWRKALELTKAQVTRVQEEIESGRSLLAKLAEFGTHRVRMRRSTLAASRHLSLPEGPARVHGQEGVRGGGIVR